MESFLGFGFLIFLILFGLSYAGHLFEFLVCLHLIGFEKSLELLGFCAQNVLVNTTQVYSTCCLGQVIRFAVAWSVVENVIGSCSGLAFSAPSSARFAAASASAGASGSIVDLSRFQGLKWTILHSAHSICSCSLLLILQFLLGCSCRLASGKAGQLTLLCLNLLA